MLPTSAWNDPQSLELMEAGTPLVDVRAPIEFATSTLPNSVNLPILMDEERAQVGTCYKEKGQEQAIILGHLLVNGIIKEYRVKRWVNYLTQNPKARVLCFRGGLRSQMACTWVREAGVDTWPVSGGYKRIRQFLLSWVQEAPLPPLIRIAGATGSGKSEILQTLGPRIPYLDLEQLANHRGSAFGHQGHQPSQATFESSLGYGLMRHRQAKALILEDESAMIGRVTMPSRLYQSMRESPYVLLQEAVELRIERIFKDYVMGRDESFFISGIQSISRKLGGALTKEALGLLSQAFSTPHPQSSSTHAPWIALLLKNYYDPYYNKGLAKGNGICLAKGNASEIRDFLISF